MIRQKSEQADVFPPKLTNVNQKGLGTCLIARVKRKSITCESEEPSPVNKAKKKTNTRFRQSLVNFKRNIRLSFLESKRPKADL